MESADRARLIESIIDVRERLKTVRAMFESITDEALIDSCIYETIALNARYRYFIRIAKENGVTVGRVE